MLSGGFPRPPGTGLPKGVPKDVSPTNQAPTAVPATRPPVPRRGRSVSSKDPAPRIEIRYSDVPRNGRNHFLGQTGLLAFKPPLASPRSSATPAAVSTWS